jgi:hypothetical protein
LRGGPTKHTHASVEAKPQAKIVGKTIRQTRLAASRGFKALYLAINYNVQVIDL